MTSDTIVAEVRAIRDAIEGEHGYDLASICRALREEARAAGIQTVSASETAAQQAAAPDESGSSATGLTGERQAVGQARRHGLPEEGHTQDCPRR